MLRSHVHAHPDADAAEWRARQLGQQAADVKGALEMWQGQNTAVGAMLETRKQGHWHMLQRPINLTASPNAPAKPRQICNFFWARIVNNANASASIS